MEEALTKGIDANQEQPTMENAPTDSSPENAGEQNGQSAQTDLVEQGQPPHEGDNTHDEKLPFHKNPRWQELVQRNKSMEVELQELKTLKDQVEPLLNSHQQNQQNTEPLPDWFVQLWGDNREAYEIMKTRDQELVQQVKQETIQAIQNQELEKIQAETEWNNWVTAEYAAMKSEGLKFEQNELMKFLTDHNTKYNSIPKTADGRPDFRKGLDLMQQLIPKDDRSHVRSQVADKLRSTPAIGATNSIMKLGEVPRSWREQ
jgi:hypothetical protein